MNDEAEVIESEELDQAEELDEESDIEAGDDNESAGDDDFSDIDEAEEAGDDEEFDDESEGEESDDEETVQKEGDAKDGTRENAKEAATDEEPGEAEILSQFSRNQIPGTDEYTDALISQAQQFVKAKTGEDYDPFDAKHQALFTQACNKLDKLATEKFNEAYSSVKTQVSYQQAFKKASLEIDTILATPELAEKFEAAIGDLKQRDFQAIQDKAAKGDFSGFIAIAKRVKGIKAKVEQINKPSTVIVPAATHTQREKPKKLANGMEFGGVADFLGL